MDFSPSIRAKPFRKNSRELNEAETGKKESEPSPFRKLFINPSSLELPQKRERTKGYPVTKVLLNCRIIEAR